LFYFGHSFLQSTKKKPGQNGCLGGKAFTKLISPSPILPAAQLQARIMAYFGPAAQLIDLPPFRKETVWSGRGGIVVMRVGGLCVVCLLWKALVGSASLFFVDLTTILSISLISSPMFDGIVLFSWVFGLSFQIDVLLFFTFHD